jgi:hypothetical protein
MITLLSYHLKLFLSRGAAKFSLGEAFLNLERPQELLLETDQIPLVS